MTPPHPGAFRVSTLPIEGMEASYAASGADGQFHCPVPVNAPVLPSAETVPCQESVPAFPP